MNRSYLSLFIALLIHFLLLLLFWFLGTLTPEIKEEPKPKENKIKVSLKEVPVKFKDDGDKKEVVKPTEVAPPMPKGSQLKKIITPTSSKPPIKFQPKKVEQKEVKELPRQKAKAIQEKKKVEQEQKQEDTKYSKVEPLPPTKPYIPHTPTPPKKEKEQKEDPLAWLKEDKSEQEVKKEQSQQSSVSSIGNSDLKELYGDDFGKLTPGQQKYLIDNQEIMRRITQEILNRVAQVNLPRDMNVNKVNIVEFYLHPNGDMSDFKFLQKSNYYILEQTTKETIEYAYSRYPRPSEKILIRYNVFYNLKHY